MLVEMGLSMVTAGLAASVAKNLLPRLLAVREYIDIIPGHTVDVAIGKLSEFTTDAIKEGLKSAGKKAIARAAPSNTSGTRQPQGSGTEGRYSSNLKADFFARHTDILNKQGTLNFETIGTRAAALKPLWRERDKQLPIRMLAEITAALLARESEAIDQQSRVTTACGCRL